MFHLLRCLKRFQVFIHGTNFSFKLEGESEPIIGFYTTRWVDAFDPDQAADKVFASIKKKLLDSGYGSVLGELQLKVDKIERVNLWKNRWSEAQGFAFYSDRDE
jgi:hypothetical protein